MPTLAVGAVVRVAGQDVLVTVHDSPDVEGINVQTGASLEGTESQITEVIANTFKAYVVGKSAELHLGNYFVEKVCQDSEGNVGYVTAYTPTPDPTWDGINLEDGSTWQSVTIVPKLVATSIGAFTTEMLILAAQHRSTTKPTRDHSVVRPNIPQS